MTNHDDIREFHEKFNLKYEGAPRLLPPGLLEFRIKFMREELEEFEKAMKDGDLVKAFDALLDLNYVSHGTAYLMGLPWDLGWGAVHGANMKKERAQRAEDSKRGSTFDVIKPPGWKAPDAAIARILWAYGARYHCQRCGSEGYKPSVDTEGCSYCDGQEKTKAA